MIRGHGAQNAGVNRLGSAGGLYNSTGEDLRVTANRRQEGEVTTAGPRDNFYLYGAKAPRETGLFHVE